MKKLKELKGFKLGHSTKLWKARKRISEQEESFSGCTGGKNNYGTATLNLVDTDNFYGMGVCQTATIDDSFICCGQNNTSYSPEEYGLTIDITLNSATNYDGTPMDVEGGDEPWSYTYHSYNEGQYACYCPDPLYMCDDGATESDNCAGAADEEGEIGNLENDYLIGCGIPIGATEEAKADILIEAYTAWASQQGTGWMGGEQWMIDQDSGTVFNSLQQSPICPGCTDINATNYYADAEIEDGSCLYDWCMVPGMNGEGTSGYFCDEATYNEFCSEGSIATFDVTMDPDTWNVPDVEGDSGIYGLVAVAAPTDDFGQITFDNSGNWDYDSGTVNWDTFEANDDTIQNVTHNDSCVYNGCINNPYNVNHVCRENGGAWLDDAPYLCKDFATDGFYTTEGYGGTDLPTNTIAISYEPDTTLGSFIDDGSCPNLTGCIDATFNIGSAANYSTNYENPFTNGVNVNGGCTYTGCLNFPDDENYVCNLFPQLCDNGTPNTSLGNFEDDDETCPIIEGCMDINFSEDVGGNYDPLANTDYGCTISACESQFTTAEETTDAGTETIEIPNENWICLINDGYFCSGDGVSMEALNNGFAGFGAPGYSFTVEDCVYESNYGCTNENYAEYSSLHTPSAACVAGSPYCEYALYGNFEGNTDPNALEYNPDAGIIPQGAAKCKTPFINACANTVYAENYYCNNPEEGYPCTEDENPESLTYGENVILPQTEGGYNDNISITIVKDDGSCMINEFYGCTDDNFAEYHQSHIQNPEYETADESNDVYCIHPIISACIDDQGGTPGVNYWCTLTGTIDSGANTEFLNGLDIPEDYHNDYLCSGDGDQWVSEGVPPLTLILPNNYSQGVSTEVNIIAEGTCSYDVDGDGVDDEEDTLVGCMDPEADNYNPEATEPGNFDNWTDQEYIEQCTYILEGCLEESADNTLTLESYQIVGEEGNTTISENGGCYWLGCANPYANMETVIESNNPMYDEVSGDDYVSDDGSCAFSVCMDPTSYNYICNSGENGDNNYNDIFPGVSTGQILLDLCIEGTGDFVDGVWTNITLGENAEDFYLPNTEAINPDGDFVAGIWANVGCAGAAETAGCTDEDACNYNPLALIDDETCVYADSYIDVNLGESYAECPNYGCMDSSAFNYDPTATNMISSDGVSNPCICNYDIPYDTNGFLTNEGCPTYVDGCMDDGEQEWSPFNIGNNENISENYAACNYNPEANYTSGEVETVASIGNDVNYYESCIYPPSGFGNFGYGCDDVDEIPGCMTDATYEDGTYIYNYDETATVDNGNECQPTLCTVESACNFGEMNPPTEVDNEGNDIMPESVCDFSCYGCTDSSATNYDVNATEDDNSCNYEATVYGCKDPYAFNYSELASEDAPPLEIPGGTLCVYKFCSPPGDTDMTNPPALYLPNKPTYTYNGVVYGGGDWQVLEGWDEGWYANENTGYIDIGSNDLCQYEGCGDSTGVPDEGQGDFATVMGTLDLDGDGISDFDGYNSNDSSIAIYYYNEDNSGCPSGEAANVFEVTDADNTSQVYFSQGGILNSLGNISSNDNSCCYIPGCTDENAITEGEGAFNPDATVEDGSCVYPESGCTDPDADNYNDQAYADDGSCRNYGCMYDDLNGANTQGVDDGAYVPTIQEEGDFFGQPILFDVTFNDTALTGLNPQEYNMDPDNCINPETGETVPLVEGGICPISSCYNDFCTDPTADNYFCNTDYYSDEGEGGLFNFSEHICTNNEIPTNAFGYPTVFDVSNNCIQQTNAGCLDNGFINAGDLSTNGQTTHGEVSQFSSLYPGVAACNDETNETNPPEQACCTLCDGTDDNNCCTYPDCAGLCDGETGFGAILDNCGVCFSNIEGEDNLIQLPPDQVDASLPQGFNESCAGCTDEDAENYVENPTMACGTFPDTQIFTTGDILTNPAGDQICPCIIPDIYGCMDNDPWFNTEVAGGSTDINGDATCGEFQNQLCQATNYNPDANIPQVSAEDDSDPCIYQPSGCTAPTANNYDPNAIVDDGSCNFEGNYCDNSTACNYGDEGDCIFPNNVCYNCDFTCADGCVLEDDYCVPGTIGCMDETACNYNPEANMEDPDNPCVIDNDLFVENLGGCAAAVNLLGCDFVYGDQLISDTCPVSCGCDGYEQGCTDETACNYDENASIDDGSCELPDEGYLCDGSCDGPDYVDVDGSCVPAVPGCTNPIADNYDENANVDDDSCILPDIIGCTNSSALNYDPNATVNATGDNQDSPELFCIFGYTFSAVQCDPEIPEGFSGCCSSNPFEFTEIKISNSLPPNWYYGISEAEELSDPLEFRAPARPTNWVWGCTDETACNYNPAATDDNGLCSYGDFTCEDGSVVCSEEDCPVYYDIECQWCPGFTAQFEDTILPTQNFEGYYFPLLNNDEMESLGLTLPYGEDMPWFTEAAQCQNYLINAYLAGGADITAVFEQIEEWDNACATAGYTEPGQPENTGIFNGNPWWDGVDPSFEDPGSGDPNWNYEVEPGDRVILAEHCPFLDPNNDDWGFIIEVAAGCAPPQSCHASNEPTSTECWQVVNSGEGAGGGIWNNTSQNGGNLSGIECWYDVPEQFNDQISYIEVPAGHHVTLFENYLYYAGTTGGSDTIYGPWAGCLNSAGLAFNANDNVSAIIIDWPCAGPNPPEQCGSNYPNAIEIPVSDEIADAATADTDGDGIPDLLEIPGCTDWTAENYNPDATDDDGSCVYDPEAPMPEAACDGEPGNWIYPDLCGACGGFNNCINDNACTNPEADNYNPNATIDCRIDRDEINLNIANGNIDPMDLIYEGDGGFNPYQMIPANSGEIGYPDSLSQPFFTYINTLFGNAIVSGNDCCQVTQGPGDGLDIPEELAGETWFNPLEVNVASQCSFEEDFPGINLSYGPTEEVIGLPDNFDNQISWIYVPQGLTAILYPDFDQFSTQGTPMPLVIEGPALEECLADSYPEYNDAVMDIEVFITGTEPQGLVLTGGDDVDGQASDYEQWSDGSMGGDTSLGNFGTDFGGPEPGFDPNDWDNDGIPNEIDLDSPDELDTDGDGEIDWYYDADNDTWVAADQMAINDFFLGDDDGDGINNYLDDDYMSNTEFEDADGDNIPDFVDADGGTGDISDYIPLAGDDGDDDFIGPLPPDETWYGPDGDVDGDGIDNQFDDDFQQGPWGDEDSDGILNQDDGDFIDSPLGDADGDGIINMVDDDFGMGDEDGDGVPDFEDMYPNEDDCIVDPCLCDPTADGCEDYLPSPTPGD